MKNVRPLLLLVLVLSAAFVLSRVHTPAAADTPRPNIVVIMTDDQDVDSLPVMEYLMSYPYGSWVNFEYAYASNSVCCPARATLLTGQYSHTHGVQNNNMGREMQDTNTLPVWLDGVGYTTALIGKYLNGFPFPGYGRRNPPGWDLFEHIRVDGNADMYTAEAVDFLQSAQEPYFLFLAYRAPHQPAKPLPRYKTVTPPFVPKDRLRPNFNEKDMDDKPPGGKRKLIPAAVIARYEAERLASQRELMGIDDGVESIIATLQAQGQLDNTMIVFLGDNGFSWGAHRHYGKHCAYEECSRIPLLIRYPELSGNHVESRLVSNVDLASTIADYAGVTPGIVQEGRSLLPLMERPGRPWRSVVLLERVGLGYNAIRTDEWKYIQRLNGGIELYDMRADPYELDNLAGRPEFAGIQSQLVAEMLALLSPHAYTLSGTVTDEDGLGLAGVAITEAGGRRVTTDSAGHYRFASLSPGEYALAAEKDGYRFTTVGPVTVPPSATGVDFTGTLITYGISGRVTDGDGNGLEGVTITYGDNLSVMTQGNGAYAIEDLLPGPYDLTASKAGYTFSSVGPITLPPDATDVDFTGTALTYAIRGLVTDAGGNGLEGVTIAYGDNLSVMTLPDGSYLIPELSPGDYTLVPVLAGYTFDPLTAVVSLTDGDATQDFLALLEG